MGRERYKTPDAEIAAEFDRVCSLFRLAQGKPSDRLLFDSLMSEASAQGLNWVEGLEYVIEQRLAAGLTGVAAGNCRRGPQRADALAEGVAGDLLKVG